MQPRGGRRPRRRRRRLPHLPHHVVGRQRLVWANRGRGNRRPHGQGGGVRVGAGGAGGPRRAGDQANTWVGMTVLQELFGAEHNAVVRMLAARYRGWDDEQLFRVGRLVVAAVIAKIHTIDWTVELLKTKTLYKAMNANWNGLLGARFKDRFGHIGSTPNVLSGLVGARKTADHGVPYSLTEEFTAVYRLHTMLPDELPLPSPGGGATTPSPTCLATRGRPPLPPPARPPCGRRSAAPPAAPSPSSTTPPPFARSCRRMTTGRRASGGPSTLPPSTFTATGSGAWRATMPFGGPCTSRRCGGGRT
eukprot:TRINITY_DN1045_c0_g1_i12.p1 TRINITY_DN1045_c0_g1~~TRINITY_DN1045_c0_g1_i12.p1  ORF type:complete len:305 (+),score=62.62 TRINITY_DN1045_c0_g1_i12:314-1228(+)